LNPANRARTNGGPTLIEYFTYRGEGHSTSDDPGAYRAAEEYALWPLGDPVTRLKDHLIASSAWSDEQHEALILELSDFVKASQKEAEQNASRLALEILTKQSAGQAKKS
jgi:2-oxoisovalerate dehydrogenase E1 component alpha subunit